MISRIGGLGIHIVAYRGIHCLFQAVFIRVHLRQSGAIHLQFGYIHATSGIGHQQAQIAGVYRHIGGFAAALPRGDICRVAKGFAVGRYLPFVGAGKAVTPYGGHAVNLVHFAQVDRQARGERPARPYGCYVAIGHRIDDIGRAVNGCFTSGHIIAVDL